MNLNNYYLSLIILLFIIFKTAFKNGKPSCNNYVTNTYLYVLFMLLFFITCILQLNKINFNIEKYGSFVSIGCILLLLFIIFSLSTMDKTKYIQKHLLWLLFIILLAMISNHAYEYISKEDLHSVMLKLIGIVSILTFVSFTYPNLINMKIMPYFLLALIIIIISQLIDKVFFKNRNERMFNYIILFVFSYFLLYDTKNILINSKSCKFPDYTMESSGLFLDIINMFQSLVNLEG